MIMRAEIETAIAARPRSPLAQGLASSPFRAPTAEMPRSDANVGLGPLEQRQH